MALNFTEKQHWKNRIEVKMEQRIEELRTSYAALMDDFKAQARKEIISSFGVVDDFHRLEQLQESMEALEEEREAVIMAIQAKVTGKENSYDRWTLQRITSQISALEEDRAETLLSDHDVGRQLAALKDEKERLTDAVLLATNIHQIIDIWEQVPLAIPADVCRQADPLPLFSDGDDEQEADEDI